MNEENSCYTPISVMISPESRNKKLYPVPVQCIPYSSMSEDTIRGLANRLIAEMSARGMRVAGMLCAGIKNYIHNYHILRNGHKWSTMVSACVEIPGLFMCCKFEQKPKQKFPRPVSKV